MKIKDFLLDIVKIILGWFVGKARPSVEDAPGPGPLEDRLHEKIKKDGWDEKSKRATDPDPDK